MLNEVIKETMVSPETLDELKKLDSKTLEKIYEKIRINKPLFFTKEMISPLLVDFKIIKTFDFKNKLTIQDYIEMLNERYSALQNILVKKVEEKNPVSINKCSSGEVSLIGMVKSKKLEDRTVLELEDPTGSIKVLLPTELFDEIDLDDVIAVYGIVENKTMNAQKVFYPDVPLKQPTLTEKQTTIANVMSRKENIADFVIFEDKIESKFKPYKLTNPTLLQINNVVILILLDYNVQKTIKKRFVSNDFGQFIIDPTPDIIFTNKEESYNYKGISVVGLNTVIDLSNRVIKSV